MFGRSIDRLSVTELQARVADGTLVVDVRRQDEWDAGHIRGSVHIPLGSSMPPDDRDVVLVCRTGARSKRAAKAHARRTGSAADLAGGLVAWASAGLPLVRPDGKPGRVR